MIEVDPCSTTPDELTGETTSVPTMETTGVRERLRVALRAAMRERDRGAVSALRTTLAAIDNAEAVDTTARVGPTARAGAIESSAVGVGAAEVARRELSEEDIVAIVRAEIAEREQAARQYDVTGNADRAVALRAAADLLAGHLAG